MIFTNVHRKDGSHLWDNLREYELLLMAMANAERVQSGSQAVRRTKFIFSPAETAKLE